MKSIALFGGSFNPPHPGHFEAAREVCRKLGVDEVWFLFSNNPFKNPADYVSKEHRMEMCRILSRHYSDVPFVACDIEESVGSNRTYEVLTALKKIYPDNHFIWVMGADNLREFHTWGKSEKIIEENPIAVLNRPGYEDAETKSKTSLKYAFMKVANPVSLKELDHGWSFIELNVDVASRDIKKELQSGRREFDDNFQEVADYIFENELYRSVSGANPAPLPA